MTIKCLNNTEWNDSFDGEFDYFNEFEQTTKKSGHINFISLIVAGLLSVVVICVMMLTLRPADNSVCESADNEVLCSDSDLIEISKVLDGYFSTLQSSQGYTELDSYCMSGSSFTNKYNQLTSNIKVSFDVYDTSARVLKILGHDCEIDKIDRVVIGDDGNYICYVNLSIPTNEAVNEYVFSFSQRTAQFFKVNSLNESNINRCLLESLDIQPISYSSQGYTIEFVKDSDGDFKIADDSDITNQCMDAYSKSVSEMSLLVSDKQF